MAAAKLPRVAIQPPGARHRQGHGERMQSGIYWGYIGLIEGWCAASRPSSARR